MKKALTIIFAAVLLLGVMPVVSFATNIVESGTCGAYGNNLTWTLDGEGVLTISGTGEMRDFDTDSVVDSLYFPPWKSNREQIESVVIEEGVTSIGKCAFFRCINLKHITIPEGVVSIGHRAFITCESLTELNLPSSVSSIDSYAFYNCDSLTEIVFPNSLTSVGEYAFYSCDKLTNISIPSSVLSIGKAVFSNCESLREVEILSTVAAIEENVFQNCTLLHALCYKNNPVEAYLIENNIAYGLLDGTVEENTLSGSVGRLNWTIDRLNCVLTIDCVGAMPAFSTVGGGVASSAPWGTLKGYIRKTIILEGASSISAYAFYGLRNMTSISMPEGITLIGENAFSSCVSLTDITIPNTVTSIGFRAFSSCRGFSDIIIPDSVTTIENYAFSYCESLSSITIPSSVTSLGSCVFEDCYKLVHAKIGTSKISMAAFRDCYALTDVIIQDGVQSIENYAFESCSRMKIVELPQSVSRIEYSVFRGCSTLERIYFYNTNCLIQAGTTPANATVYGYSGSTAETYADENGLRFMEIDGHEHHYTVTKTVEPTCTEDGYKNLSCPCGERTTETIPANGHTEIIVPAKAATCTENGYSEWSYCEVCGEPLTEKVETQPNGHTPLTTGAYAATCDKAGFTGVTYCTECKEVLDAGEPISATNEHTPGEALEIIVTAATCTEAGTSKTIVKCSACGETLNETTKTISALGHSDANGDEKCDRCNTAMPKNTDTSKKSNVFDFLIQFFKTLTDFFKRLFK